MDPFIAAGLAEARKSYEEGGIPIGAVLVYDNNQILGRGHNQRVQQGSVIKHGEMDALENAGRQAASVYRDVTLYTTLSPCVMCSGTILLYGIPRVVIGENRTFQGEETWLQNNGVAVTLMDDYACYQLMQQFIQEKPGLWNEDTGQEDG